MDTESKIIRILAIILIINSILPPFTDLNWYKIIVKVLMLVAGIGLFKFKKWAYYLFIFTICSGTLFGIIDLNIKVVRKSFTYPYPTNLAFIGFVNLFSVLILLVAGLLIFGLTRQKVKEKFK